MLDPVKNAFKKHEGVLRLAKLNVTTVSSLYCYSFFLRKWCDKQVFVVSGSLSATSTAESLNSSFICNAANEVIVHLIIKPRANCVTFSRLNRLLSCIYLLCLYVLVEIVRLQSQDCVSSLL